MLGKKLKNILLYLILAGLVVMVLMPIIWVGVSSFQTDEQIFNHLMPFSFKAFLPENPNLHAYYSVFFEKNFGRALFNSIFVTTLTVFFGLVFNSMCGFAFAVFEFKGKNILFFAVLITFMIPFEAISIPLYQVVDFFHWIDTYQGLVMPGIANGLTVFLFRQFFLEVPKEYIDAGTMDGASWWTIFTKIYIPLSIPVVISAGLILFIFQWEAFLWPLIAGRSPAMKVIQVAITDLNEENAVRWSQIFAACTVAVVIPALLVIPLQRFYVRGVTSSGIKG
jgi:multiple sugar transport system permease protein